MKATESNERIRHLEQEIAHLRAKLDLLGANPRGSRFSIPKTTSGTPGSVSGLHVAYLQVDALQVVLNCNTSMANLIGMRKDEALGQPLNEIDRLPWASGVFATLLVESLRTGTEIEFETSTVDPMSGTTKHYCFRASHANDVGNVVVEDRTTFQQILTTFRRYVSPRIIERMQDSTEDFFKTNRVTMTVLFADLRDFTSMCSAMAPEDVKNTINEFLAETIRIIDHFEATVDKIIGDEVMALFGAPVYFKDHAYRAIKAAVEMQRAHQRLLEKWKSETRPAPPVGIGINTGEMVVGNIGTSTRMDYTVLGHHVNLASRLCDIAGGGEILVSMHTVDELSRYARSFPEKMKEKVNFQKAGTTHAKGIPDPVETVKVLYSCDPG